MKNYIIILITLWAWGMSDSYGSPAIKLKENTRLKEKIMETKEKTCSKCKNIKPVNRFTKHKGHNGGYYCHCKECRRLIRGSKVRRHKNKYTIINNETMCLIITSNPHGIINVFFDIEDYETIKKHHWFCTYNKSSDLPYVSSHTINKNILIHRLIMNFPKGKEIDHKDHDRLNNKKCNLRIATHQQNMSNQKKCRTKKTSKYKGVTYLKDSKRVKKWVAQINHNSKHLCLGYFKTENEAAIAYNKAAKELFGEYAYVNKI